MKNDILYQTEYGHVRFGRDFRGLLKSCVGQKTSRYAINSIQVTKDGFVATNGQCLVVYICEHTVRPGLYHLTTEGYGLFNDTTEKFPKWQDIVPKPSKIKEVYRVSSVYEDHIRQNFIFHLHNAGVNFQSDWMLDALTRLSRLKAKDVAAFVLKKESADKPILIKGEMRKGKFLYVQMPIHTVT